MANIKRQTIVLLVAAALLAGLAVLLVTVLGKSPTDPGASPYAPSIEGSVAPSETASPGPGSLVSNEQTGLVSTSEERETGQTATLETADGAALFTLTIHSATPLTSCPTGAEGSFLVFDISTEVGADAAESLATLGNQAEAGEVFFPTLPQAFTLYDEEGVLQTNVVTQAAQDCYPQEEQLAAFIAPGESHRGVVVLETGTTTGQIVYSSATFTGWLWNF